MQTGLLSEEHREVTEHGEQDAGDGVGDAGVRVDGVPRPTHPVVEGDGGDGYARQPGSHEGDALVDVTIAVRPLAPPAS